MFVGWGGEGWMEGNICLLESHPSYLKRYQKPQKVILPHKDTYTKVRCIGIKLDRVAPLITDPPLTC